MKHMLSTVSSTAAGLAASLTATLWMSGVSQALAQSTSSGSNTTSRSESATAQGTTNDTGTTSGTTSGANSGAPRTDAAPANSTNSGANANNTGASGQSDTMIVRQLAEGGMAEVELGKLASQRAEHSGVKEFGKQMVDDHSSANAKLMALAKRKNITVPTELSADHKATKAQLEKLNGAKFDAEYIRSQISDHQKTVQLLQQQASSGNDLELRQFATDTLPVVRRHLEHVQQLQRQQRQAATQSSGNQSR